MCAGVCVQKRTDVSNWDFCFGVSFFPVICSNCFTRKRNLGSLYASEEAQVERAGDLDGFQGEGGRAEGERDRINHLCVHQQLGALAAVSQAGL